MSRKRSIIASPETFYKPDKEAWSETQKRTAAVEGLGIIAAGRFSIDTIPSFTEDRPETARSAELPAPESVTPATHEEASSVSEEPPVHEEAPSTDAPKEESGSSAVSAAETEKTHEKKSVFTLRDIAVVEHPSERRGKEELSEDVSVVDEDLGLYAVIDGMGGYEDGRKAADTAKKAAIDYFQMERTKNNWQPTELTHLGSELVKLHYEIKNTMNETLQGSKGNAVGTFVTAREIDGQKYLGVLHAGDTRMFIRSQDGEIRSITTDQSRGNSVFNSLRRMRLKREGEEGVLGDRAEIEVIKVAEGDRVLLCSDGITGDWEDQFLTAEEMQRGFMQKTAKESAEEFYRISRKVDDKTAVVFDI